MFCNQCGQGLPDGSRFCNFCGAVVGAGSGQAERNLGPLTGADVLSSQARQVGASAFAPGEMVDEEVIFTLRPTLVYVAMWYALAVMILIAIAAVMGLMNNWKPEIITGQIAFFTILATGMLAFAVPVYKHILRRREVYTLTSHKLEMSYGLIAKTVRNIPLRNIQDVTVTASVFQRFMKLGDIVIDSASETGRIHLDEVHHPDRYADMILSQLRRRN